MFRNLSPGAIGIQLPFTEALDLAHRTGWEGMDLPTSEALQLADQRGTEAVSELYAQSGLRVGGWGLPLNWREPYEKSALETLKRQAALAQKLDSTRCYTWLLPFSDQRPFRENFAFHVEQIQPIAEILAEHGCSLGLEFIGPRSMRASHRYGFIYTIEGMLSLAAAIGPNVGLLVDAWHWHTGLGTLSDLYTLRLEDVVYVHINDAPADLPIDQLIDNKRALPGVTGVIDLKGFLSALGELGYNGPVTPEPFDSSLATLSPEEASIRTLTALNSVMGV